MDDTNPSLPTGPTQVLTVEGLVSKVGTLVQWALGINTAKPYEQSKVEWQKMAPPERSKAEQFFARYSALGQALMSVVQLGVGALPFGAPVAAVLGTLYARAQQV